MDAIWIIEEDGTHTPGKLVRSGSVWPGSCTVIANAEYAALAGVSPDARLWSRRNVLDAEGNRLG